MNHDDGRDAHLLAALRHAPDRDVAPPAQLSAAILGQARQAARAKPGAAPSRWRALWAGLWQPAPMAAFGTLAMATLIGVMWQGQEVPEAAPSLRPDVVAAAPAPAPAAPTVVRAEPESPIVPSLSRETSRQAQGERTLKASAPTTPAQRKAEAAAQTATVESSSTGSGRTGMSAPPVQQAKDASALAEAAAAGKITEPMAPAPPSSPSPPAAPMPPALAAPMAAAAAPATREGESRRDALAKSMADAAPAAAAAAPRARSEMPFASLGAALAPGAAPLAAAGAEIDAAMRTDPIRVRWRTAAERQLAHDAAQREWWAALNRATQGRWQRAAGAAPTPALTLLIDGAARGSIGFEPQAVVWRDASGSLWRAAVAPETWGELQAATARW